MVVGVILNLSVGIFVHRLPARWLVTIASLLSSFAPLIMAKVNPSVSYWVFEFWSQVFTPLSADVLFTIGLIIVSDNFPKETQALAGAVFSTVTQFGQSLGVGVCQVVALSVTENSSNGQGNHNGSSTSENPDETALLRGYRASFWTMFAYMVISGIIAIIGLRNTGKIGLKRE
jgi:nitrate/nitrite transporter NarK